MGDYHTRSAPHEPSGYEVLWKFGTCQDWRGVRREQVEAVRFLDAGHQASVEHALGPAGVCFRFPWPDEDERAQQPEPFDDVLERSAFLLAGPLTQAFVREHVEHRRVQVSHQAIGDVRYGHGTPSATTSLTCPLDPAARAVERAVEAVSTGHWFNLTPGVCVVAQRWDAELEPYTIFACPYCRTWFRIPHDVFDVYVPDELKSRVHPSRTALDEEE